MGQKRVRIIEEIEGRWVDVTDDVLGIDNKYVSINNEDSDGIGRVNIIHEPGTAGRENPLILDNSKVDQIKEAITFLQKTVDHGERGHWAADIIADYIKEVTADRDLHKAALDKIGEWFKDIIVRYNISCITCPVPNLCNNTESCNKNVVKVALGVIPILDKFNKGQQNG